MNYMNLYNDLTAVKADLGITATTDDARLLTMLKAASRAIDNICKRHFYTISETRFFDGAVPLWIDDLLSINTSGLTTDEDGNATFENTFATTDYILYPLNEYPKIKIELSPDSDYGSFGYPQKGCSIAGLWGYGDGISVTPYTTSGDSVQDTGGISATATSITVTDADNFSAGQNIVIPESSASEQCYVSAINSSTNILTVIRAINGTTGATHAKDKTIYIYDYPADIEQVCLEIACRLFAIRGKAFQSERLGDYAYTLTLTENELSPNEKALLQPYKKMRI